MYTLYALAFLSKIYFYYYNYHHKTVRETINWGRLTIGRVFPNIQGVEDNSIKIVNCVLTSHQNQDTESSGKEYALIWSFINILIMELRGGFLVIFTNCKAIFFVGRKWVLLCDEVSVDIRILIETELNYARRVSVGALCPVAPFKGPSYKLDIIITLW